MKRLSIAFLEAVRSFLKLKRKSSMREMLKEGYLVMAGESEKIMNDFKNLDSMEKYGKGVRPLF